VRLILIIVSACVLYGTALAIDAPDYQFDWVTVGDPGNPAYDGEWLFDLSYFRPVGRVDRVYRVTRTEVTVGQWFEFLEAYAPYYTGFPRFSLTGVWITPESRNADDTWNFATSPAVARYPTSAGMRFMARFCNWLHNGKANEAWAFEDGVYDASLADAIVEGDGTITDFGRRPGARFWIPSFDEWVKAMFWDPDKGGPGQGGYWAYPHSSDEPPVPGVDTNAGYGWVDFADQYDFYDVGTFPHAASPWGLLDGSGGEDEWMDYEFDPWFNGNDVMVKRGTIAFFSSQLGLDDWIGKPPTVSGMGTHHGFRLASLVPCTADFAVPFGVLDLQDVVLFITAFLDGQVVADLAEPFGLLDLADVSAFAESFSAGCLGE